MIRKQLRKLGILLMSILLLSNVQVQTKSAYASDTSSGISIEPEDIDSYYEADEEGNTIEENNEEETNQSQPFSFITNLKVDSCNPISGWTSVSWDYSEGMADGFQWKLVSSTQKTIAAGLTTKHSLKLSWNNQSGASGYDIYISKQPDRGFHKVKSIGKNARTISLKKYRKKRICDTYCAYVVSKVGNFLSQKGIIWKAEAKT